MRTQSLKFISIDDCEWTRRAGFGGDEEEAVLFEGDYGVRVILSRIPAGWHLAEHSHTTWATFTVIKGRKRVELEDGQSFEATAGSAYFVRPGQRHIETALEETTSVVVYDSRLDVMYY